MLYPLPSNNEFTLELLGDGTIEEIQIFGINGTNNIKDFDIEILNGNALKIQNKNQLTGVFLVNIKTNKYTIIKKLLLNND